MSEGNAAEAPPEGEEPEILEGAAAGTRWVRDWRVWLGIAVTVLCLWLAMRDVPLADVRGALATANVWLIAIASVIGHIGATWLRAVRWRYMVESVVPVSDGMLYRGQALGFMLNNLLPMRMGELARAWYVARATEARLTAILGTIVVERLVDVVSVLVMAMIGLVGLSLLGVEADQDGRLTQAAIAMLPLPIVAIAGLVLLRLAPDFVLGTARLFLRPLPARLSERVEHLLQGFIDGVGSLRGGWPLAWVVVWSVVIWMVFAALPVYAGLVGFGLDLGTPPQVIVTSWVVLAAVGMAVAIPSAPGFFGLYQYVFQLVLAPFGVDSATAFAVGLVVWFFFWILLILQGFAVLRGDVGRIFTLTPNAPSPGKAPIPDRR